MTDVGLYALCEAIRLIREADTKPTVTLAPVHLPTGLYDQMAAQGYEMRYYIRGHRYIPRS